MRGAATMAALIILMALSGCTDGAPVVSGEEDEPEFQVQASAGRGVIRGVVVDDAVVPVEGASVALLNQDQSAMTDANGAFGFSDLEPGTYFLEVSRIGYGTVQSSAEVAADDPAPPIVKVVMTRDPSSLPYTEVREWQGYLACGLSLVAVCGPTAAVTNDEFSTSHEIEPEVTMLQSEMIWESTQQVSETMKLWQEGSCGSFDFYQDVSPVVINTSAGDLGRYGSIECFKELGKNDTRLQLRVFSGMIEGTGYPLGDCYPAVVTEWCNGPGFVIEQEFAVFSHIFHKWRPFEDWQFSIDGTPDPPG